MEMFDAFIEIMAMSQERDDYNERTEELLPIAACYAQRTENGGRENMYASRIVHENEVVYTIRFREKIKAGQFVKDREKILKITSVHEEGRRKFLHLKTMKSDADTQS